MKFKAGDKVICINIDGNYERAWKPIVGNVYTVCVTTGNHFDMVRLAEDPYEEDWFSRRFTVVYKRVTKKNLPAWF